MTSANGQDWNARAHDAWGLLDRDVGFMLVHMNADNATLGLTEGLNLCHKGKAKIQTRSFGAKVCGDVDLNGLLKVGATGSMTTTDQKNGCYLNTSSWDPKPGHFMGYSIAARKYLLMSPDRDMWGFMEDTAVNETAAAAMQWRLKISTAGTDLLAPNGNKKMSVVNDGVQFLASDGSKRLAVTDAGVLIQGSNSDTNSNVTLSKSLGPAGSLRLTSNHNHSNMMGLTIDDKLCLVRRYPDGHCGMINTDQGGADGWVFSSNKDATFVGHPGKWNAVSTMGNGLHIEGDLLQLYNLNLSRTTGYGNMCVSGHSPTGWKGYSIDEKVVFMLAGDNSSWGLHDNTTSWKFHVNADGTHIGHKGVAWNRLSTTDAGVTINGEITATANINCTSGTLSTINMYASGQTVTSSAKFTGLGTTTGASSYTVVDASGNMYKWGSSKRYKINIENISDTESENILDNTRCVKYNPNPKTTVCENPDTVTYGIIAEEMERIDSRMVTYNQEGECESVHYMSFVPILLKELKKLRDRVTLLEKKI
jgi:hypothetical protein